MSGFFLSSNDFSQLSQSSKDEILMIVSGQKIQNVYENTKDGPIDLSSLQAEKLVRGLSDKSRAVLKLIIESNDGEHGFWCKNVAKELNIDVSELSGVWSGLTRRTRTVSDDSEAYLIAWAWDDNANDYYGKLHTITYNNCKKAMNL